MDQVVDRWEVIDYVMVNGKPSPIRQRWECEPPGPIGSGIDYLTTDYRWTRADDGVWERIIYAWEPL